ncbi:MAG: hypothetical protein ABEJ40_03960 [Haloarculaceae archaeon]
MTGRDAVTDRVVEFVEGADDEVIFTTDADLLTDGVVGSLRAAGERGVAVRVAGMADGAPAEVAGEVPAAEGFEPTWDWSATPAGRPLMVDRTRTLVSVLVDGDGDHPPEPLDETAVWGAGEANGLVVVLRALFAWQLDGESA